MSKAFKEAYEQASRLEEGIFILATKAGANNNGLNHTNALRALDKAVSQLNDYEQHAKDLGYTSLGKLLEGAAKTKKSRLPALYDVAPLEWIKPARIERVRNGLRERTYKVPAVGPKQAQALLKGIRPLLEQLYELWDGEAGLKDVEDAYKTLSYEEFLSEVHLAVYEALTGEVREEVDEAPSPSAKEPTLEAALAAVTHAPNYGVEQLV